MTVKFLCPTCQPFPSSCFLQLTHQLTGTVDLVDAESPASSTSIELELGVGGKIQL